MMTYFTLKTDKNAIATLTFNTAKSKINIFTTEALQEFENHLDTLSTQAIKALFIESAKEDIFIAGADISEIKQAKDEQQILDFVKYGQDVFTKLEDLPFPTIAMIDGACLGGGLEMAMSCDYRIATIHPHTRLGLPEVLLGILPGFGGTQRLCPLVGYAKAIELIVGSKRLKGEKALKLGLVDAAVPRGYLSFKKRSFIQEILEGRRKKNPAKAGLRWYEKFSPVRAIISKIAKTQVLKKTGGHYPAPLAVIDVMQRTYGMPLQKALEIERQEEMKLALTPISKNLIELFFISETLKKETFSKAKAKPIKHAAIVGTGTMGSGITWALNNQDIDVRLKVRSSKSVTKALSKIQKIYEGIKKRGRLTSREIALKMDKITSHTEYVGFSESDFLLEAVSEDVALKQEVYTAFEAVLKEDAIIATNTSSLSISDLAIKLQHPERFIGMHFFNPVNRMPLIEIIAGEKTDDATIATVVALSKQLGKTPIKVKESAGFLVNRILMPYLNECALMFEEGASCEHIDKTLIDFGMPMGAFTLIDTVGADIGEKVSTILHDAYGSRMKPSKLLSQMVAKKWLGKKTQKGFYLYQKNKASINPQIQSLQSRQNHFETTHILDRAMLIMINEAAHSLEEKVVDNARYLDMAMVMGTGFPAFRGGLLRYGDTIGVENIIKKLNTLRAMHGERFAPANLLIMMAQKNQTFYGGVS